MSFEQVAEIYKEIRKCEVCKRCTLRYLPIETFKPYSNPDDLELDLDVEPPESKQMKMSPCRVCLGIFSDEFISNALNQLNIKEIKSTTNETFKIALEHPGTIHMRDRSMRIYLKDKFPGVYNDDLMKIGKIWRFSIQKQLETLFNKQYKIHTNYAIRFEVEYDLDMEETASVDLFDSKKTMFNYLADISDEEFQKMVAIPPKAVLGTCSLTSVTCGNHSFCIVGRYVKYSRTIKQGGVVPNVLTVESVILEAFENVLGYRFEYVFKSRGGDSVNHRILGRGKAFYVVISDFNSNVVSEGQLAELEMAINGNNELFRVKGLRQTSKTEAKSLVYNDILCSRTYRAICSCSTSNVEGIVDRINSIKGSIVVRQKTPLQNLIARPNERQERRVLRIKAAKVEDHSHLIDLEINVEYGLFVEEFLHGDLGRSNPSLKQIVQTPINVVAVDLVDVDETVLIH